MSILKKALYTSILLLALISCNQGNPAIVPPEQPSAEESNMEILGAVTIPLSKEETTRVLEDALISSQALVDFKKLKFTIPSATVYKDRETGHNYLSATLRITNNTGQDLTNLTLRATVGVNSIGGTSILQMNNPLGQSINLPEVARSVRLTHRVFDDINGDTAIYAPTADYQAFRAEETAAFQQQLSNAGLNYVALDEGFVAHKGNSRTIPAGETGTVTLATRFPYDNPDATKRPFGFSLSFMVATDKVTRFTRSEFNDSTELLEARVKALYPNGVPDDVELMLIGNDTETASVGKTIRTTNLRTFVDITASDAERFSAIGGDLVTVNVGGRSLTYEEIDNLAIYQGDIVLGSPQEASNFFGGSSSDPAPPILQGQGVIARSPSRRWSQGIVPYVIDESSYTTEELNQIKGLISRLQTHYINNTNIRIVPRTTQVDYISITNVKDRRTCGSSYVGVYGSKQSLWVSPYTDLGCFIHEFAHALGMGHEQTRADRDNFIKINFDNILPKYKHNFEQNNNFFIDYPTGTYDYDSIMHYPSMIPAFSRDRSKPLITVTNSNINLSRLGQRNALSNGDIASICKGLYPNVKPIISITSISANAAFANNVTINLAATIVDQLGNPLNKPATWTISGVNKQYNYSATGVSAGTLPAGNYTATLQTYTGCTDSSQEVQFSVKQPEAKICTGNFVIDGTDTAGDIAKVKDCKEIQGDLRILGTNLTNFNDLNRLTKITGYLCIGCPDGRGNHIGNANLTSLRGLENLTSVGSLTIDNNDRLNSLQGLNNLTDINGTGAYGAMYIDNNNNLTSLSGLDNLTTVRGIHIKNNAITNLNSLSKVTLTGWLSISNNSSLTSLQGLNSLSVTAYITINNNDALKRLNGLDGVSSLTGHLSIGENDALNDISALGNLTSIGSSLNITRNKALTNLEGLNNVATIVNEITITHNNVLSDISAVSNVRSLEGQLFIANNNSLTNLNGFRNITTVGGSIYISENAVLSNLNGLENLRTVKDSLYIRNNPTIASLSQLSSLSSIGGNLDIVQNSSLKNLVGLENLQSIGGRFSIDENNALTTTRGLNGLTSIGGNLLIFRNAALQNLDSLENLQTIRGDSKEVSLSPQFDCSSYNQTPYRLSFFPLTRSIKNKVNCTTR